MGILDRISVVFKAKVLRAVDRVEDPRETLEYAYERQRELLANVRRALVEVSTSKHQLGMQARNLEDRLPRLEDQARRALAAGREDLARVALERRQFAAHQLEDIRRQLAEVGSEEQRLILAERRFTAAVEAFRTKRDVMSARYTAARAKASAGESLAGASGEITDLGSVIERAETKIGRMQARASALDELLGSGVLDDLSLAPGDRIEQELRRTQDEQQVEAEMAALKDQLKQQPSAGDSSQKENGI